MPYKYPIQTEHAEQKTDEQPCCYPAHSVCVPTLRTCGSRPKLAAMGVGGLLCITDDVYCVAFVIFSITIILIPTRSHDCVGMTQCLMAVTLVLTVVMGFLFTCATTTFLPFSFPFAAIALLFLFFPLLSLRLSFLLLFESLSFSFLLLYLFHLSSFSLLYFTLIIFVYSFDVGNVTPVIQ